MDFNSFGMIVIACYILRRVGKIKVQNKELLPHEEGTAQGICTLTLAGFLFSIILFYVGFFYKMGYAISPTQEEGIHLLAFFIVGANIIYLFYQIRNKNLHALAQYIAMLLLNSNDLFHMLMEPLFLTVRKYATKDQFVIRDYKGDPHETN